MKTDLHGFIGFILLIIGLWLVVDITSDITKVFKPHQPQFLVRVNTISYDQYMEQKEKNLVDSIHWNMVKEKLNLK